MLLKSLNNVYPTMGAAINVQISARALSRIATKALNKVPTPSNLELTTTTVSLKPKFIGVILIILDIPANTPITKQVKKDNSKPKARNPK